MKTAGVVIDNWKLTIFKKHLDAAGYVYTEHPELDTGIMVLKVEAENNEKLTPTIEAAYSECRKQ